jgi:P27 family predicted phage terminase small subunit
MEPMKQRGRKSAASLSVLGRPRLVASQPIEDLPPPPDHLADPERRIWTDVVRDWKGTSASYVVLVAGLEARQRARECREIISVEGLTITGRDGQIKSHPLCTVERDSAAAFQRTFRALGIKI